MRARWLGALLLLVVAFAVIVPVVDLRALALTARAAIEDPWALATVLAVYAGAFAIRAATWRHVLPAVSFGHGLAALHVALAGNKLLPFRLGEALRVTSVVRRTGIPLAEATASTVVLRGADILAAVVLAAVLGPRVVSGLDGTGAWLAAAPALLLVLGGVWWLRRLGGRLPGPVVAGGALTAWILESAVLWQAARWAGIELTAVQAVLVTAVTVAAQVAAVAPGGLGTYEAAATGALVAVGARPGPAFAAALTAHAVNTVYALLAGAVAAVVPAPALFGRWRLPRRMPLVATATDRGTFAADPDAPVLLFLPAHDEEAAVAGVINRVPPTVCGRPVRCLVVDDGSTDGTAGAAAAAGAEVSSLGVNRGLGAAVRHGLAAGLAADACVVAFCDADGEYAPEELERLIAPILAGQADYVVGSRFAGQIRRMAPCRRLGNRALTTLLRFVARTPVTDGQSGYRALSAAAAAQAEIVHDFNYAQVLTLNLLGKGFRYAEVPISYGFRETGRSFVRLGPYLRHVVPAVHAELNRRSAVSPGLCRLGRR
ncbi:MAG: lysylphosphatidylglycerol synthase domain-containing protein [Egibacteraceae bacterium]